MSKQLLREIFFAVLLGVLIFAVWFLLTTDNSPSYPDLVASVKKFVFFVGYARSGHSIIGALMDAHPHVIIAHEFFLFSKFGQLDAVSDEAWKRNLFDRLYCRSTKDEERSINRKGYTLSVESLWQGRFDDYVEVIGDKGGNEVTRQFLRDKEEFKRNYAKLEQMVAIPIRIIHAVRNPFDIISTTVETRQFGEDGYGNFKLTMKSSPTKLNISEVVMRDSIREFFDKVKAVTEMTDTLFGRKNVLEVHNNELVANPRETLSGIFQFLELDTSDQFLDKCAAKVFKSVSRSRDTIVWSLELKEMVERKMNEHKMFDRYNFTSE